MVGVSIQGLQEGPVQVPANLDELLRQAQLLLQHVIEHQYGGAVSCQGCAAQLLHWAAHAHHPPGPSPHQRQLLWAHGLCSPQPRGYVGRLSRSAATWGRSEGLAYSRSVSSK